MTIEEEIEGNKILHKFLTGKEHNLPFGNKYNLSWDKLMPVYQKLAESVISLSIPNTESFLNCYMVLVSAKSKQEMFEALVECVKELNKAQGE
jgi:hypothetical protein